MADFRFERVDFRHNKADRLDRADFRVEKADFMMPEIAWGEFIKGLVGNDEGNG